MTQSQITSTHGTFESFSDAVNLEEDKKHSLEGEELGGKTSPLEEIPVLRPSNNELNRDSVFGMGQQQTVNDDHSTLLFGGSLDGEFKIY